MYIHLFNQSRLGSERLGSKCYYGWDFYYAWVQMLLQMGPLLHLGPVITLVPSTDATWLRAQLGCA